MSMRTDRSPEAPTLPAPQRHTFYHGSSLLVAEMKARQTSKIRELGDALISTGFLTLDNQAKALGLSRSTTWTILKANHKSSGLSAAIINRMLVSPQLPPLARSIILEYIEEKAVGLYGGSRTQRHRFAARLSIRGVVRAVSEETGRETSRARKTA
jgi:hypothetical protein